MVIVAGETEQLRAGLTVTVPLAVAVVPEESLPVHRVRTRSRNRHRSRRRTVCVRRPGEQCNRPSRPGSSPSEPVWPGSIAIVAGDTEQLSAWLTDTVPLAVAVEPSDPCPSPCLPAADTVTEAVAALPAFAHQANV